MDYKKQQIETALLAIEPEKFQELCDAILQEEVAEYAHFVRTGSKPGKRKTQKGTPDTTFKLPNGKWLLVETTTQERDEKKRAFLQKLEGDIQKCLTKFPPSKKVEKILLCTNSKVSDADYQQLSKLTEPHGITLQIKGLDDWAGFLAGRYQYLANDYLGLPFTNWQVVSLNQFLAAYQKAGFQPGLDNQFYGREKELGELKKAMMEHPFVLVKGKQGLGKSKLCIEAIRQFLQENSSWSCFCITNPTSSESVFRELQTLLYPDRNYILLLDDANRHRQQLADTLALARQERVGKIHILATVRDYAANSLLNSFTDSAPIPITIDALEKEALLEILQSPDFKIRNEDYQRPILRLAQGNVRILVMLAQLAIEKQNPNVFNNVSEVYDKHFNRVQNDCELLKQPNTLKVLGLLSFFYTIDMDHGESFNKMLRIFNLKEEDFRQIIGQLHEQEFIELSEDRQVAKSSDQSLASYVFFRVFIRDGLLSFTDLLDNYFWTYKRKIRESVISASNDFDSNQVAEKITPTIRGLWTKVVSDEAKALDFMEVFWFYLPDECLAFAEENIQNLPAVESPAFDAKEQQSNNLYIKDKYIQFLHNYLYHPFELMVTAIELGFDYVAKLPETMPEWFKALSDGMAFTREDQYDGFYRQYKFWNCLESNIKKGKEAYLAVFPALASLFLRTSYSYRRSGDAKHSMVIHQYQVPGGESIKDLRSNIWKFLKDQFSAYPSLCFNVLKGYPGYEIYPKNEIYSFDLPYLLDIIEHCLNPEDFSHCLFVHTCFQHLKRRKVKSSEYERLKRQFTNHTYRNFKILARDRYRNKEEFELDHLPHREYERLKNAEVSSYFQFGNFASFQDFYRDYNAMFVKEEVQQQHYQIDASLDQILFDHFSRESALALSFIETVVSSGNETGLYPHRTISKIATSDPDFAKQLLLLIRDNDFLKKEQWLLSFFFQVSEESVDEMYYETLMSLLQANQKPLYLNDLSFLTKFTKFNEVVFRDALALLIEKSEKENIHFEISHELFKKYLRLFKDEDLPLLKKTYIICESRDRHFDYDSRGLLELAKRDSNFVLEYFEHDFKNTDPWRGGNEHEKFGLLWELENAEELVESVLVKIAAWEKPLVRSFYSNGNQLFLGYPPAEKPRIETFLLLLVHKHAHNFPMTQILFNIVRSSFHHLYEAAFLELLKVNSDLEFFKQIPWGDSSSGVRMGRWGSYNLGDEEAERWRGILEFLKKVETPTRVIRHRAFVNEQIAHAEESAKRERRRHFQHDF